MFNISRDQYVRENLEAAVKEFRSYVAYESYFNKNKYTEWKKRYNKAGENKYLRFARYLYYFKRKSPVKELIRSFFRYYDKGERIRRRYNKSFTLRELRDAAPLFESIEKYPLEVKQREAVVHDEDNNLIIAGAGTGKTTTIVGKFAYLTGRMRIDPGLILLLAFTEKAAGEMRDRIRSRVKNALADETDIHAYTFHSVGYGIISAVRDYKPDIIFDSEVKLRAFMRDIYDEVTENERYRRLIADYLVEYMKPYRGPETFSTKGEYIAYLRSNNNMSLKREELKSFEEVRIANYLFLNNVEYVYEEPYKHKTRSRKFRQYRPDFYLPEYDLYIEHWGVNKEGRAPAWFDKQIDRGTSGGYLSRMKWVRELHAWYGTHLIETYSHEIKEGVLIRNLEKKLRTHGVRLKRKNDREILRHYDEVNEIPLLLNLIITFMNLYKSNRYTYDDVIRRIPGEQRERTQAFLQIFGLFFNRYEDHLRANDGIDFNDMIAEAAGYIRKRKYIHQYKYILVDEFQDISASRKHFIMALLGQSQETKLFCVGDDWQSIYRFTGADVSIMTGFEKHFGYTHKVVLDRTYRYNDKLLSVTSDFISKNPAQIKKKLKTGNICKDKPVEVVFTDAKKEDNEVLRICAILNEAASEQKRRMSVFIISRYNFNKPGNMKEISDACLNLDVEAITAHKSKGLEADYVIIKSVVSGTVGFPCGISDDPLVNYLLSEPEKFEHAEERRLFYVAMTRAREMVYMISHDSKPSPFIKELDPSCVKNDICPECIDGFLVKRTGIYGAFSGCTNYPYCRYTSG